MLIKKKKKKKRLKKKLKCNIPFDECETLGWDREGALSAHRLTASLLHFSGLFSCVMLSSSSYWQQEEEPPGWGLFYLSGV